MHYTCHKQVFAMSLFAKLRIQHSLLTLCVTLLLVAGFVQAAHAHESDLGASKHCSTCMVSHSAVSTVAHVQAIPQNPASELVAAQPDAPTATRSIASARIRPPPAA
jgi:hypothetical protein